MPATERDLSRRIWLACVVVGLARAADPAQEVWDAVAEMAAALGRASSGEFLAICDAALPGFEGLRANVQALVLSFEVESAIDPVSNTGDDRARDLEIDWQMQLIDRTGLGRVTRRRQAVKCRLELRGRKWKMVALDPVAFFAPPSA